MLQFRKKVFSRVSHSAYSSNSGCIYTHSHKHKYLFMIMHWKKITNTRLNIISGSEWKTCKWNILLILIKALPYGRPATHTQMYTPKENFILHAVTSRHPWHHFLSSRERVRDRGRKELGCCFCFHFALCAAESLRICVHTHASTKEVERTEKPTLNISHGLQIPQSITRWE